jgi:hypothetical protein
MATTTNYSWSTPDDTALVKDGAAAIRTLGSSVDTTVKALSPGTTAGDVDYYTTSTAKARLGIGTAGQVLKVNSGATAPEWGAAGGGVLYETVFTSSDASWTIPTGVTGIWALCVGSGGGGGATKAGASGAGAGGAGQVLETFFTIAGDTTLNITVPAGGTGATSTGTYGGNGSAATIVGNTSSTTYASAEGGGGGAGGSGTSTGTTGASGGGNSHSTTATNGGGGGGMGSAATNNTLHPFGGIASSMGGGGLATTNFITGHRAGNETTNGQFGGIGITLWGRFLGGGGHRASGGLTAFGSGTGGQNVNGGNATANTGSGGGAAGTTTSTVYTGGNGGSGLVVLRYVGA